MGIVDRDARVLHADPGHERRAVRAPAQRAVAVRDPFAGEREGEMDITAEATAAGRGHVQLRWKPSTTKTTAASAGRVGRSEIHQSMNLANDGLRRCAPDPRYNSKCGRTQGASSRSLLRHAAIQP